MFETVQGGSEVIFFNIQAHVLGPFHTEDTVPHQFGGGEVSCLHSKFARVIDKIATCRDANLVRICFLGAKVDNDASICHSLTHGDKSDLLVSHDKNRIGTFLSCFIVALHHACEILTEHCLPNL